MDRETEIALLEELQGLKDNGLFFLDDDVCASPVERYASEARFEREREALFRSWPLIAAHGSELPDPGSFLTLEIAGLPVLLTRDKAGDVNAFLNVCRHRGMRLVGEAEGCKHAFSCPYHAWTWSNDGTLRAIPHEKPGFPGIDLNAYALRRLPATERLGFIWIVASPDGEADFDAHIGPLKDDFTWFDAENLGVAASNTFEKAANWKLLIEGGIEAYHFKVAHRDTIGPHFLDNLSSYEMLGSHMRSVLPRSTLSELTNLPREDWSIRAYANVLYSVFPTDQFLVMQDHVGWLNYRPLAAGRTEIRLTTLAPRSEITADNQAHWDQNHKITSVTLGEDFAINTQVQAGLATGANVALTFGRYEGALNRFNAEVEAHL